MVSASCSCDHPLTPRVCVCMCVRERDRDGGWETVRERGREMGWEEEEGWLDMNGRRKEGRAEEGWGGGHLVLLEIVNG